MDEPFTLVERSGKHEKPHHLFQDQVQCTSAPSADHDIQYLVALRKANPELIVTTCQEYNTPLRAFAAAGFAKCEVDLNDDYASWRGYVPPSRRSGQGSVGENVDYARYHYQWSGEDFVLYLVQDVQYILKEQQGKEHVLGPSSVTDSLIRAVGDWRNSLSEVIWVYDGYWEQSHRLWKEVQKASWDKVILDEGMKDELVNVAHKFFDSEAIYRDLGVPWKRGLLFHGPPGNGKTISSRALMHSLDQRKDPIPTLYVKSAPYTWDISQVFRKARSQAPCMLVLEDVETIVTPDTRSYFFNEMDGLENNDGLFIVASTNFLDRLDPGLSKRPSRFDRKYLFPNPNEHERTLYCEFWRQKLKPNKSVIFPKKLCPAMAHITDLFSFAFLQECFVATLLLLAQEGSATVGDEKAFHSDDLDDYELWIVFRKQADVLRKEVLGRKTKQSQLLQWVNGDEMAASSSPDPPPPVQHRPAHCQCCHASRLEKAAGRGWRADELLPSVAGKYEYINPAAYQLR